ncbi:MULTISPECIES: phosphate--AMP phosphotransferase [Cetobacterium]|jgi:polyphosphate:AMP phosphotransferase|uniref:Phosphate--AMP phosphotransferase n=1 Tax=Candidatus Cetobacterium colombiensis TaxID=3073100 RepID=A0ABU4WD42_9FUSO|nr:phosphate--AMP phosphotransferase [Candidatus Cetobacterium colombiensis]MDX8337452.1 phosphate--AMP phosphotransferase [Candidatus Cetobacterium colombiensis]
MGILSNESCLKMKEKEYNKTIDPLKLKLAELQRTSKEKQIPILIIFEGLEASGKGSIINEILVTLDPRGYKVVNHNHPLEQNTLPLKQYIDDIPGKGEFHIFDKSWYDFALKEGKDITRRCKEINKIERSLLRSGMLIIKFFIHVSKKTQKKRYFTAKRNPAQAWKVTPYAWEQNFHYKKIVENWEDILERTNNFDCGWNIVSSNSLYGAKSEIFRIIVEKIESYLHQKEVRPDDVLLPYKQPFSLDDINLDKKLEKKEYKKELEVLQEKIFNLHHELYTRRVPLIIAYEGWDAAGKGGNIKRVVGRMDPRGYDVIPIAAPNDVEKNKHYLWRFWKAIPRNGHVSIFDRTWYGRVLVERVEKFATKYEWKRSYQEINDMEKQWVDDGAIIIKFWLQISKEEQLKRFKERQDTPEKNWKITEEDWRNREKWKEYKEAIEEMISRTSTTYSPWNIVPANDKYYARIFVLKKIIKEIERKLYGVK